MSISDHAPHGSAHLFVGGDSPNGHVIQLLDRRLDGAAAAFHPAREADRVHFHGVLARAVPAGHAAHARWIRPVEGREAILDVGQGFWRRRW